MPLRPRKVSHLIQEQETGKGVAILAKLQQKAKQLSTLTLYMRQLIPPALHNSYRVANYRGGILVVESANASFLWRLRMLQSELVVALRRTLLPQLITIELTINPQLAKTSQLPGNTLPSTEPFTKHATSVKLGMQSGKQLQLLALQCKDPLRAKLLKLAAYAENSYSFMNSKST